MENYSSIWKSLELLKEEAQNLDDQSLVEEILFINIKKSNLVITALNQFIKLGNITQEQRILLENFYILVYIEE